MSHALKVESVLRLSEALGVELREDPGGNRLRPSFMAFGPGSRTPLFRVWLDCRDGQCRWIGRVEHMLGPNEVTATNMYVPTSAQEKSGDTA